MIQRYHRLLCRIALATTVLAVATTTAPSATRPNPNPVKVLPTLVTPYGNSYGDWSASWWQWAFSLPAGPDHPLFDETGAQCGAGQSGPVWFLGGVFNVTGSATRDQCVVPAGKALFFPILNVECSNVEGNGTSSTELRLFCDHFVGLARDLVLEIDGSAVSGLENFRVQSGTYNFTLPEGNLLGQPAGTCLPDASGICQPNLSVSDGFYVMLSPLSVGRHTIHFKGTFFGDSIDFTTDVTYHLTVQ